MRVFPSRGAVCAFLQQCLQDFTLFAVRGRWFLSLFPSFSLSFLRLIIRTKRHRPLFFACLLLPRCASRGIRPRVIRLDAAYWGLHLIAWIHATLHAVAVIRLPPRAP